MADVSKKLEKGQLLFREGDASDAMYVVKKGRIIITKTKGESEIELAEMGPGQMFGEMAFFDKKPRSANARAASDSEIISLPFANLEAHFKAMPEWLKSMVKTINEHLREANKKIKILERTQGADSKTFPPHTITKLCGILGLVTERYGEKDEKGGLVVPTNLLRNYTIQVFQEATNKMDKMQQILQSLGIMTVEDLGEGRKKITVLKHDFLMSFVEFYNDWLFKEESKRILVEEKDLPILKALLHYGRKLTPDDKGMVKVNLNMIQNESMKDLGYVVSVSDYASVSEKKIVGDKSSEKDGVAIAIDLKMLEKLYPFWELIYIIEKFDRSK
jgi:CRP/FNR family cyclic AMP-dependent transcriptional regulator